MQRLAIRIQKDGVYIVDNDAFSAHGGITKEDKSKVRTHIGSDIFVVFS